MYEIEMIIHLCESVGLYSGREITVDCPQHVIAL